jgi:four helix bundle protein
LLVGAGLSGPVRIFRRRAGLKRKVREENPKSEYRNPKQIRMTEAQNSKHYDLEDRTFNFAKNVRFFIKKLPQTLANREDARQLINSSGSVGANYIEANEALSKKDFLMRIKICRKEAKESRHWLRLLDTQARHDLENEQKKLEQEATELMNIFGSIVRKSE